MQWAKDLDFLDAQVRLRHPEPFVDHPETEWVARIAALKKSLPTMSADDAKVAMIELVALLDTHSGIFPEESGFHMYGVQLWEFSDGPYVLNATDPTIVGARLDAIGNTPVAEVLKKVAPLVNADNESALHWLRPWFTISVESLHSLGIVTDEQHPKFHFTLLDGSTKVVDPPVLDLDGYTPLWSGPAESAAPPAWQNQGTPVSSTLTDGVLTISYNSTGAPADDAISALETALDAGAVTRVLLDMRYAGGGDFSQTYALRNALADSRIPSLYVLIGPDNISAATALASSLEQDTKAVFVGEPTPARPNTLLDEVTFTLPTSGLIVHIPTTLDPIAGASDTRDAVRPDIPSEESGSDFFAGRDTALAAALAAP